MLPWLPFQRTAAGSLDAPSVKPPRFSHLALGLVMFKGAKKSALPGWNSFASICAKGTPVGKTPACHPTLRVTTGGHSDIAVGHAVKKSLEITVRN